MREYKNIVSLGFYCGPAQEIERMGYRSVSLPFDWLIVADFQVVLRLIDSHFEHFLLEEDMVQEIKVNPRYYFDKSNKIHFYHDFNATDAIKQQLPAIRSKYSRRIERFYQIISEPVLFIRYCFNEEEYNWICNNIEYVRSILKKYNHQNDIVFVCNNINKEKSEVYGDIVENTFFVCPDKNDTVNRRFMKASKELKNYITSCVHVGIHKRIKNKYYFYVKVIKKAFKKIKKKD